MMTKMILMTLLLKAFVNLIESFGWKSFTILYEDNQVDIHTMIIMMYMMIMMMVVAMWLMILAIMMAISYRWMHFPAFLFLAS